MNAVTMISKSLQVAAAPTPRETLSNERADSYLCSTLGLNKADSLWHGCEATLRQSGLDGLVGKVELESADSLL